MSCGFNLFVCFLCVRHGTPQDQKVIFFLGGGGLGCVLGFSQGVQVTFSIRPTLLYAYVSPLNLDAV